MIKNTFEAVNSEKTDLLFVAGDVPDGVFKLFNRVDYKSIPALQKTMLIAVMKSTINSKFVLKKMIGLMQDRKFDSDIPTDLAYCLNVIDYELTDRTMLKDSFQEIKSYIKKHLKLKD